MKIGFISLLNPHDRKVTSGTLFKMYESLDKLDLDVVWISGGFSKFYDVLNRIYLHSMTIIKKITNKNYIAGYSNISSFLLYKLINKNLIETVDILFVPFSFSIAIASHIKTNKPIIYLSDATFDLMIDYNLLYFNLFRFNINQGLKIEKKAMDKSAAIVLSSDWARKSVINDYLQPEEKVHIIEFGANIDDKDIIMPEEKSKDTLHLLFSGVDWQGKGGDIAIAACEELNKMGINSIIHIAGITNLKQSIIDLPFVDYIGFLDKNIPEQYSLLIDTIKKCHCLLLPTQAEAAGIVFVECSAFGLPSFSYQTGGVGNYVLDGQNGYLLPLSATAKDFAKKISECYLNGEMEKMSHTAIDIYKSKLNWDIWGEKIADIIKICTEQKLNNLNP